MFCMKFVPLWVVIQRYSVAEKISGTSMLYEILVWAVFGLHICFIAFGCGFPWNTINKYASARDSPFMSLLISHM